MSGQRSVLVIQQEMKLLGGGSIAQKCVIDALRELGNKVYTLSFCGTYPQDFPESHFTILSPARNSRYMKYFYNQRLIHFIKETMSRVKPDVVFIGQAWDFLSIISAVKAFKIPIINIVHSAEYGCLNAMLTQKDSMKVCLGGVGLKCRTHGCESWLSLLQKGGLSAFRNYMMKRHFSAFVCHSNFMIRFMQEQSFKNIHYIPLNPGQVDNAPSEKRAGANQKVQMLFVGSLSWHKGVLELVDAMRLLAKEPIHYHLNIVGEGVCRKEIEEIIINNSLHENISVLGNVNNGALPEYYKQADIVLLPSYFESFSLVTLEAMKFNRYLIVSERGALKEVTSGYDKVRYLERISASDIRNSVLTLKKELEMSPITSGENSVERLGKYTKTQTMEGLDKLLQYYL